MWRCDNTRYGSDPICSGSEGIAKSSQVPGNPKGQPDVQQLQALCSTERVPDRRWNNQPKRLVHGLSEGVAALWHRSTIEGSSFSGLLTRVEISHIRIGFARSGRIRSPASFLLALGNGRSLWYNFGDQKCAAAVLSGFTLRWRV